MAPNKVHKEQLSKNFLKKYKEEKEYRGTILARLAFEEKIKPYEMGYYDSMMNKYRSHSDLFVQPAQKKPFVGKNHRYFQ